MEAGRVISPALADMPAVILADDQWAAAWDAYTMTDPDASFYLRYAWKRLNENALGHRTFFLAAVADEAIVGVFPLVLVQSRLFGRILCSMPFVNYGGPCAGDIRTVARLTEEAIGIANEERVDYLEIRSLRPVPDALPTSLHKVSMTITLPPDPEVVWSAFSSKHRTAIRRAYKNGLRAEHGGSELLDHFYEVLAETWRGHGTPIYAKRYFSDIQRALPDHTRIYVVYADEKPVAAAFNGHHNGVVEGLWAGNRPTLEHLQANYVLYWEMIKRACEDGFHTYHLGRSTAESGGEFFKKKWNAQAKQLYWQYYMPKGGELPRLNVDNPKYRFAIALWRRLPIGMTTAIGSHIANYIP